MFLSIGERAIRANFILLTFGVRKWIKGVLLDSINDIMEKEKLDDIYHLAHKALSS